MPAQSAIRNPQSAIRRAFTLVEALVALLLASLVTAGVAFALRTGLDASSRIRERSDSHAEARAALEVLEADLQSAFLSGANTGETLFRARPPDPVDPDQPFLSFTTLSYRHHAEANAPALPRSDQLRVDYLLAPDPDREDGARRLLRRERWLTEEGEGETTVLCERVAGVQLGYTDGNGMQDEWTEASRENDPPLSVKAEDEDEAVKPDRKLPRAVDVTLLLAPASGEGQETPPRAYHTLVMLQADGAPPFETEVQPPQKQSGGTDPNGAGSPPAAPGQPGTPGRRRVERGR